jgi:hypothetical protein
MTPPPAGLSILKRVLLVLALSGMASWSSGCTGRNIKADNPVIALVPPRVPGTGPLTDTADGRGPADTQETSDVSTPRDASLQQVAHEAGSPEPPQPSEVGEIAAFVNGTPILVSDVLERYSTQLSQAKAQLSSEEFERVRSQLIRRELPEHIEQAVLVHSALSQLDADKRTAVEQQLDQLFTAQLEEIKAQMQVGTLAELEAKMQASGTTLASLRRVFGQRQLAGQAMALHGGPEPSITRKELLDEYERRKSEYTQPAQAQWQQLWISYAGHGGRQQALAALDRAVAELRQGKSFDEVARTYSNGVMAKNGGHWDWTQRGSLADAEVDRLLFELPVGEISHVIEGQEALQLVRVTKRRPEHITPFEEVQTDLAADLKKKQQKANAQKVIDRLMAEAVIENLYEDP